MKCWPLLLAALGLRLSPVNASPILPLPEVQDHHAQQLPAGSSLSIVAGEPHFTFDYTTDAPNWWNWIAIYYASGGEPHDGVKAQPSVSWNYAPEASGRIRIPTESLQPGKYRAYLLAKDGYEPLADPVEITLPRAGGPATFYSERITLRNARQGDPYEIDISGMLAGGGPAVRFTIVGSERASWLSLSPTGILSGTPDTENTPSLVTIEATGSDTTNSRMTVAVPVRPAGAPLVERLRVLTYNLWHGGTRVNDYHAKQVRFLAEADVDVVGLQECTGNHALRLAEALGWYSIQGESAGLISRHPIAEVYPNPITQSVAVRLALDGDRQEVNMFNVHLGYNPYGPYDFCFDHMDVDTVMSREAQSGRTPQIMDTMAAMQPFIDAADDTPVLLTGDFNAPSHRDWVPELSEKNCGYSDVPWPTSTHPTDAGLIDSFREVHPNPSFEQGITWSPIFLENNGRPEPLDRIDFIYYKGNMGVRDSHTLMVGDPQPEPNHENNEWTSDHRAVVTEFQLQ